MALHSKNNHRGQFYKELVLASISDIHQSNHLKHDSPSMSNTITPVIPVIVSQPEELQHPTAPSVTAVDANASGDENSEEDGDEESDDSDESEDSDDDNNEAFEMWWMCRECFGWGEFGEELEDE